jgi:cytochrome c556
MIRTVFAIASVAAIALGVTAAVAQQDVIKERKALMKANGAQAKIGADMVKGDKPFDAAAVHKMFAQFQDAAAKMRRAPRTSPVRRRRTISAPRPRFGMAWPTSSRGSKSSPPTPRPPTLQ